MTGSNIPDDEAERRRLGDKLRQAREYVGFSQDEVAGRSGELFEGTPHGSDEHGERATQSRVSRIEKTCGAVPAVDQPFYRR
jgi:hypothetical protein